MKNTFAVTMTLLVALTLGGSFAAYRLGTAHHGAEETHSEQGQAKPGSEAAPSAAEATTGAAATAGGASAITGTDTSAGDSEMANADGTETTGEPNPTPATEAGGGAAEGGETGQQPGETAVAAETQGDVTAGEKTFVASCAGCHGANGAGGVGPSLANSKTWTLAQFTTTLREGKTPQKTLGPIMPRFTAAQLTDSDIANVFTYVKTLN